ncbi:MAG: hypothetical protein GXO29_02040 [Thermotogae bacterium]|nr:hypothetical protein [Thermotogota bacterium]
MWLLPLLDTLLMYGGLTGTDLTYDKDLATGTSLKPPVVLNFLADPLKFVVWVADSSDRYARLEPRDIPATFWPVKFRKVRMRTRFTVRDSVIGRIISLLHCVSYFTDRAIGQPLKVKDSLRRRLLAMYDPDAPEEDSLLHDELRHFAHSLDYNLLLNALSCLLDVDTTLVPTLNGDFQYEYITGFGKVAVGGKGSNTYRGTYVAIYDLGGDDTYILDSAPILIVDVEGNDRYSGSFAAGILGVSVLYDLEGDDAYVCDGVCGGVGLGGFGLLYDGGGDDYYSAGYHSLGAGTFGGGYLIDVSGNDMYKAVIFGQGFAGIYGVGILSDRAGSDIYTLGYGPIHTPLFTRQHQAFGQGFSMGWRDDFGGGVGILADASGNDVYSAGTYAQGVSYWYALGLLYDGGGDDRYICAEYCQGAGIHISVGGLKDSDGNDLYYAQFGPSIGEGHDLSVGFFYDSTGNDTYYTSGGFGVGLTNSVGIFVDGDGKDNYSARELDISFGGANRKREMGGVGLFLDLGRDMDTYPFGSTARNSSLWVRPLWGLGWDR